MTSRWLIAAVPVAFGLAWQDAPPLAVFAAALVSIVPLVGLIGDATERLAARLGPTLGGLSAEVLKLLLRRLRPDAEQFGYAFRSFADGPWSNRGMGLPSSHTLVAFAGAFALARLFPRARWVFYVLAAGCGLSRVMATAHFLSDTVVAACVAWGVVAAIRPRLHARPAAN